MLFDVLMHVIFFCICTGPFRYLDATGVDKFVNQMEKLRDMHGERFEIAPILYDYAKDPSKKFHSLKQ